MINGAKSLSEKLFRVAYLEYRIILFRMKWGAPCFSLTKTMKSERPTAMMCPETDKLINSAWQS